MATVDKRSDNFLAPCLKITSVKDCFSKMYHCCISVIAETIYYVPGVPFLYRFRYNCQSNVRWYAVLSGFPSYITIKKVTFFTRVHFLVNNNILAYMLFDLLSVRETRQSLIQQLTKFLLPDVNRYRAVYNSLSLSSVDIESCHRTFIISCLISFIYIPFRLSYTYMALSTSHQNFLSLY